MGEPKSLRERFYDLVHKEPDESGHWIWIGRTMTDGWGPRCVFDLGTNKPGDNRIVIAGRFAYEDAYGVSLKGQKLKRLCSNKLCVNPAHHTPWLSATGDRRKLLNLATTAEERAASKDAQKRQERKAPYLAMHWAKGVAKELVRQRALLLSLVESQAAVLAELAMMQRSERLSELLNSRFAPSDATATRVDAPSNAVSDAFRSAVPNAYVSSGEAQDLVAVLDRALALRMDLDGPRGGTDLFRAWLRRFALECEQGEREPTVSSFAEAVETYDALVVSSSD